MSPELLVRVLVIEDDELDQRRIRRALGNAAIRVTYTPTLLMALALMKAHTYDVVLVDRGLPDVVTGRRAVKETIAAAGGAEVIVLSDDSSRDAILGSYEAGAWDYLIKSDAWDERLEVTILGAALGMECRRKLGEVLAQREAELEAREARHAEEYQELIARAEALGVTSWTAALVAQVKTLPPPQKTVVLVAAIGVFTAAMTVGLPAAIAAAVELARLWSGSGCG